MRRTTDLALNRVAFAADRLVGIAIRLMEARDP
jgi:hypothetical protein